MDVLVLVIAFGAANCLALALFLYCDRKNMRIYLQAISYKPPIRAKTQRSYSLSERFQSIQNIRFAKA
jgi:C. elegans Sre G protein-coupled chemoreceptor